MDNKPRFIIPAPQSQSRESDLGSMNTESMPSRPPDVMGGLHNPSSIVQGIDGGQSRPPRRKRVACQECRQAKLRCDASTNASGICSHCRHVGRVCQVNTAYKRVNRRLRVEELAAQVQHLRSVVASGQTVPRPSSEQSSANHASNSVHSRRQPEDADRAGQNATVLDSVQANEPSASTPSAISIVNGMASPPASENFRYFKNGSVRRAIDHVNVNQQEINELFHIFFESYHPYMNILDPSLGPDDYYNTSPLLFWAIVSVAARRYEAEPTLISSLAPPFMKLLWNTIAIFPHKAFLVKAILLICVWPFPTSSMWTDPSFTLISIAKATAVQLGLHRPEIAQDFNRQKTHLTINDIQESTKIWAACYIVAQSITVSIGQQPLINVDWAIDRACELGTVYTLSDDLRYSLLIQQFSVRICQVMSENKQTLSGLPAEGEIEKLLEMLETELDTLQRTLGDDLSATHEIMIKYAALQLRIFYFFERSKSEVRREGLLRAFETSLSVVSMLCRAEENQNVMQYAPSHFGRIIVVAGVVLLKVLHSRYSHFVDFEAGKRAFNQTISLLRNASIENNDLHGRSSKILAQLWGLHSSLSPKNEEDPTLKLRTRSSASVLHDALWLWRERFGKEAASYIALTENTPQEGMSPSSTPQMPHSTVESAVMPDVGHYFGAGFEFENMSSIWDSNLPLLIPIDFDENISSFDMPIS